MGGVVMSDTWYYAEGGTSQGPVTLSVLLSLLSRISDPGKVQVWRAGFEQWQSAANVPEIAQQLPPPLAPSPPEPRREPVASKEIQQIALANKPLSGIGGWLALVAVGQVIGVIKLAASLVEYYSNKESQAVFEKFPLAMWGEALMNISFVVLVLYATVLLFRHDRRFPQFYIYEWIAIIVIPALNALWVAGTLSYLSTASFSSLLSELMTPKEVGQSIAALIAGVIWCSYILKSRRVANTFVK
jgi:hypothetical protein